MPTETFFKLAEEKRKKIIEAGKDEFSSVSLDEASIKKHCRESRNCQRKLLPVL